MFDSWKDRECGSFILHIPQSYSGLSERGYGEESPELHEDTDNPK